MTTTEAPVTLDTIDVSLRARSKTGRYYSRSVLRTRLADLDGALFRDTDRTWYLRTTRSERVGPDTRIVILFTCVGTTARVLTLTSDHYDWDSLNHVQEPPFRFVVDTDSLDESGT